MIGSPLIGEIKITEMTYFFLITLNFFYQERNKCPGIFNNIHLRVSFAQHE